MSKNAEMITADVWQSMEKALRGDKYVFSLTAPLVSIQRHILMPSEVYKKIPFFRQRNAEGYDLLVEPQSSRYSYLMLDRFTPETLRNFRKDGFEPCARVTIGEKAYLCILRMFKTPKMTVAKVSKQLCERYALSRVFLVPTPFFLRWDGGENTFRVQTSSDSLKNWNCRKTKKLLASMDSQNVRG